MSFTCAVLKLETSKDLIFSISANISSIDITFEVSNLDKSKEDTPQNSNIFVISFTSLVSNPFKSNDEIFKHPSNIRDIFCTLLVTN